MQEDKYESCISACYACATACKQCADEFVNAQEPEKFAPALKLAQDCSTMCLVAAIMMAGDSDFVKRTCELCADICEAAADACQKHAHLAHGKGCADACRSCAAACRELIFKNSAYARA